MGFEMFRKQTEAEAHDMPILCQERQKNGGQRGVFGVDTGRVIGRDAVFLTLISAVSQLLGFGYRVALSRLVGAQVMGLYQLIMPAYSVLMSLTAIGLTAAVSNLSARWLAQRNLRAARQTVGLSLRWFLLAAAVVGGVSIVLYDPISVYLLGDARTQLGLVLLVPCVMLTGVENVHKYFFYGSGKVRPPALVELTEQFVRAGAVLGLLVLLAPRDPEQSVGVIVTGMILCEVVSAATLVVLYRRWCRRVGNGGRGERAAQLYRRIWAIAAPVGLTALLGNGMNAANAALIPQRLAAFGMSREQAMSAFGVVCGMTMPMLALPTVFLSPLNLVVMPRVARAAVLGQKETVRWGIGRSVEVVSLVILPCMALLMVLGGDVGLLLFGQSRAGEHIVPLAVAMAMGCYQSVLTGGLNATDHSAGAAAAALIGDVVQLAVTVYAVKEYGLEGYAAGVLISSAVGLLLCAGAVRKHTGMKVFTWRQVGMPGLAALLCWQTSRLLYTQLLAMGAEPALRVGVVLLFGGLVFVCAACAMGLNLGVRGRVFPHRRENLR